MSRFDGESTEKWKPLGVTTIQGKVLAKDFVSWALNCMEEELLNIAGSYEGNIVLTEEQIKEAKKASANKRDAGASTGSEAHALVEHYLKGEDIDVSKASEEAIKAYRSFYDWYESVQPLVINVEEPIYSESYDYAGCYDCMLEIDGKVVLCDFKTTSASRKAPKGVYAEMFTQMGGYAWAHEEQRRYEENHGGTKLRMIEDLAVLSGKKDGKFDAVYASELGMNVESAMNHWKMVVQLNNFLSLTTKLLGGK